MTNFTQPCPWSFTICATLARVTFVAFLLCGASVIPAFAASSFFADQMIASPQERQSIPRIQLAILLDTSSSMNGLINQTRDQLWTVVNEFAKTSKNGMRSILEVAVYEYGNSGLPSRQGYLRKVSGLTRELDQVSEALHSLTTKGGSEYCGYAIKTAVENLQWSVSDQDLKAIFIAGNEPFTQGPVPYQTAIALALRRGITVNTIHAGSYAVGAQSGWKHGALLAQGNYMSIEHNHRVTHVVAPQDKELAQLNIRLNKTYVPYGPQGEQSSARQQAQDTKTKEVSLGLLAKRIATKSSALYNNSSWDLVDATDADPDKLASLSETELPSEMRTLSAENRRKYIQQKAKERKEMQNKIAVLTKARNAYIAERKSNSAKPDVSTMDGALTSAIRAQGKRKNFVFSLPE